MLLYKLFVARFGLKMAKQGLYANIAKRRAAGKAPRPVGSKGAPTAADFKNAAKTAKKRK